MSKPVVARTRRDLLVDVGQLLMPSIVAAAIAGFVIAGVGGRLAMLILRLTSGARVIGLESDDGFTIGRVTPATFALVLALTVGATLILGPLYAVARPWVPSRWRVPVFTLFFGIVGGALLVHADGIDFTALSPRALAVGLFIAIPAAFGGALEPLRTLVEHRTRLLPERLLLAVPFLALVAVLVIGPPGIVIAVFGFGAVALGQGERLAAAVDSRPVAWAGRLGMVTLAGVASVDLARDLGALF